MKSGLYGPSSTDQTDKKQKVENIMNLAYVCVRFWHACLYINQYKRLYLRGRENEQLSGMLL